MNISGFTTRYGVIDNLGDLDNSELLLLNTAYDMSSGQDMSSLTKYNCAPVCAMLQECKGFR